jgi:high-affinity nickel-transport protein
VASWLDGAFELVVAVMLLLLGGQALRRTLQGRSHAHDQAAPVEHGSPWLRAGSRPLAVGLVHGLAGSGALTVLVMTRMPSAAHALVYIALFGAGSALGMAGLSGLLGRSIGAALHTAPARAKLTLASGVLSLAVGTFWGFESARGLMG